MVPMNHEGRYLAEVRVLDEKQSRFDEVMVADVNHHLKLMQLLGHLISYQR